MLTETRTVEVFDEIVLAREDAAGDVWLVTFISGANVELELRCDSYDTAVRDVLHRLRAPAQPIVLSDGVEEVI